MKTVQVEYEGQPIHLECIGEKFGSGSSYTGRSIDIYYKADRIMNRKIISKITSKDSNLISIVKEQIMRLYQENKHQLISNEVFQNEPYSDIYIYYERETIRFEFKINWYHSIEERIKTAKRLIFPKSGPYVY